MILLSVLKLDFFFPQNVEKGALLMRRVLALIKSMSLLQLQHLFVVEKLHMFFTLVIFKFRLCQCYSCSIIVLFTEVLAGGMTM